MRVALYTGSFDPLTNGHLDVIRAAVRLCDTLVVAIGRHATKTPMLDAAIRIRLVRDEAGPIAAAAGCALTVETFSGLAVAAAREFGASVIVRGLRGASDLDDEMTMAAMNGVMAPEVQTVLLPAAPASRFITGTLVRQIAVMGGDVSAFVPSATVEALKDAGARST